MKHKKMKILALSISFILILIGVIYFFITENEPSNFTNIQVSIQMQNKSYPVGQKISGKITLINGNNKTIYLCNVPSYKVDILSNATSQKVWSYDYPSILILRKKPIPADSVQTLYEPTFPSVIPPGNYTIIIKVSLYISLDDDVNNAVDFVRTTQTFVEIQ